jgi:hypothetical protein
MEVQRSCCVLGKIEPVPVCYNDCGVLFLHRTHLVMAAAVSVMTSNLEL